MRVLISGVGRDIHPTGVCRAAANHARALHSTGAASHVTLAVGRWQRDMYQQLLGSHVSEIEITEVDIENRSLARNYWFYFLLPKLAEQLGAELVHAAFPIPIQRKAFPCPVVVTLHDMFPYDSPETFGFPRYYANRAILRQCIAAVDGIACISRTTRERLEAILPSATSSRAGKCVPVVMTTGSYIRLSDDAPMRPGSSNELSGKFLLAVAQHRKNKNLDIVLRSYTQLLSLPEFEALGLVVVGADGPETAALNELVQSLGISRRISGRVQFLHSISDAELHWLYLHCSALVVASSFEGYCLPAAEALAAGARVVCSDIAALREACGARGLYFALDGNAVENLTRSIHAALSQPAGKRESDAGISESATLAEHARLYRLVLAAAENGTGR